jgi:integrase
MAPAATRPKISGHLQVRGDGDRRRYFASWWDENGSRRTTKLGPAHIKDSGRKTSRGATIWRTAPGPCPPGHLTPAMAEEALEGLLDGARVALASMAVESEPEPDGPTFGDAVDAWLEYLEVEKRREYGTLRDARNVANAEFLPWFGKDTPLTTMVREQAVLQRGGRRFTEIQAERRDTFTTDDIDAFRRHLLTTKPSPRTAQKILILLHGVFKLAKRRKMILANPSADAERVSVPDSQIFNVLDPVEFEAVSRAVLLQQDDRPLDAREEDAIDKLDESERELFGAFLSTAFYAGLRLGELRDLPWRNVDFAGAMIRVETGFSEGRRSTTKGKRARSTPLVPTLSQRLAALGTRARFTRDDDYVFSTAVGGRVTDKRAREIFYAALVRAGLGHRRDKVDLRGNPQQPIRIHDLRHSWCTWAVNVWDITKVQDYAGHTDIKTTRRYVHHKAKAEDADLAGAYLASALSEPTVASH